MTDNLGSALLATQQQVKNPALDSTNPHFHSRFASLGAHLDAIVPVANTNGLVIVQEPHALTDGTPALRTRVIHASTFEFIESTMPLVLAKPDPQGQGSAITYARRYALAAIFGVTGEPDDDGNRSVSPRGTATDAAVSRPETPAPAAASPAAPLVEKAQAAAETMRANQRPDVPVALGDNKYQVTTFVERVDGPNDKGWHDIYVLIEGKSEKLSTKLKGLHEKAYGLQQTTAVVTYKETQNGSYVNRYLDSIEPAPELAETFAGVALPADDIPFAAVIW